jgi:Cu-processing system ATP-binding protein
MNISINDLVVEFGRLRALDRASLSCKSGEITVLAGPNGAGKSTLLNVILGLVSIKAGVVEVDGRQAIQPGRSSPNWLRKELGYLPERVAFSGNLTGRQVMQFFARARKVSFQRAEETLSLIGLSEAACRKVRTYSRGMRQRLGLGVSLLSDPRLLILDEPTGGLDQQGLSILWQVFRDWKADGRTVIVSTHELALIERRADRIHVLEGGRVRASGTASELCERSGLPPTLRLGPGLDEVYEKIIGALP